MSITSPPEDHNPNPGFGKIPLSDFPRLLFLLFVRVPTILTSFILFRPFSKSPRTWKEDLKRTLTRSILTHTPLSFLRRPASISHYSTSSRFSAIASSLNKRIQRPSFAGNWVCTPNFSPSSNPKDSDIVILFIHGGGYVISDPVSYSSFLLRIAETIIAGGKTVSIFNLEYSLAPEAKFPTQIQQAGEAYSYLVKEVGVEESKIALMGDSAGGSIALGFLTHLQSPISSLPPIESLGRPGKGLYLISPWISLFSQNGYKETEESDLLEAGTLQRWANFAIGKKTKEEFATYTEFAGEVKGRASLRKILSERVWVSAGEDELFLENIKTFVRLAEAEGVDVKLEVKEGKPHDWQMAEAVGEEKAYLEGKLGDSDEGLMVGCWGIGRAILEWER